MQADRRIIRFSRYFAPPKHFVFRAKTIVFRANTLDFCAKTFVFRAKTLVFCAKALPPSERQFLPPGHISAFGVVQREAERKLKLQWRHPCEPNLELGMSASRSLYLLK